MDQQFKERIDRVNEATSWSSIIASAGKEKGTITCPFCLKKSKGYLYSSFFKCFSSRCGVQGDKIVIHSKLKNVTYYEALKELEGSACLDPKSQNEEYTKRSLLLNDVLDAYHDQLNNYLDVRKYLNSRGFEDDFIDMMRIGYAPHNSVLAQYDISKNTLVRQGLSTMKSEFFWERIMFPIYNLGGDLVHLTGRKYPCRPDEDYKYLDSRAVPVIGSSKDYLLFEDQVYSYLKRSDTIYLVEGVPDSFILKQMGLPVVGIMGLAKIMSHADKFRGFKKIVAMFDNDRFEVDHPLFPNELKSWRMVTNQLIDMQLYFGDEITIEVFMVPEHLEYAKGYAKDINDLYLAVDKNTNKVLEYINAGKIDIVKDYILKCKSDISCHRTALKLVSATGRCKNILEQYIPQDMTVLQYALQVLGN